MSVLNQLERSSTRRKLTLLCADSIIQYLENYVHKNPRIKQLNEPYLRAVRVTLGVAVRSMTGLVISPEMVEDNAQLYLFKGLSREIDEHYNGIECNTEKFKFMRNYIGKNKRISEEDLGGISELFTGHSAIVNPRIDGKITMIHNPERRGVGKIYTPFDVTEYMCKNSVKKLISRVNSVDELFALRVLDPAVGSGAFCSQFIRCLWKSASRKWKLKDEKEFKIRVCEEMIHACDIDQQALDLARIVLWISAGCPSEELKLNFSLCDSLSAGPCFDINKWYEHTGLETINGYDLVIGNPPYVMFKKGSYPKFKTADSRNLYCLFTELSINLLNEKGHLSFIVPQSIVGAVGTQSLRDLIFEQEAALKFQVFDSVPDFLFDQGKIESNTNTSINQRTTIVFIDKNSSKSLTTSPLMRWKREERNILFQNLSSVRISQKDVIAGKIPMLENKDDLSLYRILNKQKMTISDTIVKEGGKKLIVTKAVRYFISALNIDLGRPNTIHLNISEEYFDIVHASLNSNLFYWWWRVNGNGFQVEKKDILSFPILPVDDKSSSELSNKLEKALDSCRVFKRNAGKDIPNINYNYRQDILQEIDMILLNSIDKTPHGRIFGCKTNSLSGDMSSLRGYREVVKAIK